MLPISATLYSFGDDAGRVFETPGLNPVLTKSITRPLEDILFDLKISSNKIKRLQEVQFHISFRF